MMAFYHFLFLVYISLHFEAVSSVNTFNRGRLSNTKFSGWSLSWQNCGPSSDPIQLKTLAISPDPIRVPGNLTIDGSANVAIPIPMDIHASVFVERKVGPFFVKVPCVDNFGSCSYANVCELWAQFCPKMYAAQYGLPCQCPIPANAYSVSNANFFISRSLPSELLGEYRATADFGSSQGHLGCINIDLTIKK